MKCPFCGSEMLEFPMYENHRKILSYFLCIDCVPYVRIVQYCKWRVPKYVGEDLSNQEIVLWCSKIDKPCNVESDAKTGYVYCPQIREWGEKQASWAKGQNRDFEEKQK